VHSVHGAVAEARGRGARGHDEVVADGAGGEVGAGGGQVAADKGVLLQSYRGEEVGGLMHEEGGNKGKGDVQPEESRSRGAGPGPGAGAEW